MRTSCPSVFAHEFTVILHLEKYIISIAYAQRYHATKTCHNPMNHDICKANDGN